MVTSRNWMESGKNSWSHARVRNDIVLLRIRQLRWPFSLTVCSNPTLCLTDLYSHPAWTKGYLLQDVSQGSHFPTELSVYFTSTLGTFHIIVPDCWLLFTTKLWAPPWFYICMALAYQCMPVGYGWDNGGRERVWEHPKEKEVSFLFWALEFHTHSTMGSCPLSAMGSIPRPDMGCSCPPLPSRAKTMLVLNSVITYKGKESEEEYI